MAELTWGAFPPVQNRVRPDPVQNRVIDVLYGQGCVVALGSTFGQMVAQSFLAHLKSLY